MQPCWKVLLIVNLLFIDGNSTADERTHSISEVQVGDDVLSALKLGIGFGKAPIKPPLRVDFDTTREPKYERLEIISPIEVDLPNPKCLDTSKAVIVHPKREPRGRKYPIVTWAHGTNEDPSLVILKTWARAGFFVIAPYGCKDHPKQGGEIYFQPLSEDQRSCVEYALDNFPKFTDKTLKVGFAGASIGAGASAMSSFYHEQDNARWEVGGVILHTPHMFNIPKHPTLFFDTEIGNSYVKTARPTQKFYLQLEQPKVFLGDSIPKDGSDHYHDHFKDVDAQFWRCFLNKDRDSCDFLFGTKAGSNVCDTGVISHHFPQDISGWGDISNLTYEDRKQDVEAVLKSAGDALYTMVFQLQACARDRHGRKESIDIFYQSCVGGVNGQQCANHNMCESGWCEGTVIAGCQGLCQAKRDDGSEVYRDGSLLGIAWDKSCASGKSICGICGNDGSVPEGGACSSTRECRDGFWCAGTITLGCKGACEIKHKEGAEAWKNALGVVDDASCGSGHAICGICGEAGNVIKGGTCSSNSDCVSGHWCEGQLTMGCLGQCQEQRKDGETVFKNTFAVSYDSSCISEVSVCGSCGANLGSGQTCWKHSNCQSGKCVNTNSWFSWLGGVGTAGCNGVCNGPKIIKDKDPPNTEVGSSYPSTRIDRFHVFTLSFLFACFICSYLLCFQEYKEIDDISFTLLKSDEEL